MNLTITQKKDNPLLERWEVTGKVAFEQGTCSNAQLTEALAKELLAEGGLIVLKQIKTLFGLKQAAFSAVVYKTAEAKQKFHVVPSHLKKREKGEKKTAEKKA